MNKISRCLLYIAIGVILDTAIILIFVLTFMHVRTPKFQFGSVSVQTLTTIYSTPPYFTMKLNAQVTIKNTNFGTFEFDNSTATVSFGGLPVGRAVIGKGKVKARSTKRVDVSVSLSSKNLLAENIDLRYNFDEGKLKLTSQGTLKGKVYLLKVIKRKKSAEMNCFMDVNIKTKKIENLHCGKCIDDPYNGVCLVEV